MAFGVSVGEQGPTYSGDETQFRDVAVSGERGRGDIARAAEYVSQTSRLWFALCACKCVTRKSGADVHFVGRSQSLQRVGSYACASSHIMLVPLLYSSTLGQC